MNERTRNATKNRLTSHLSQFGVDLTNIPINQGIPVKNCLSRVSHVNHQSSLVNLPFIHEQIYQQQILNYLTINAYHRPKMEIEQNGSISHQINRENRQINGDMRSILVEWITVVHRKFNFKSDTLFLTIHIIDSFCESFEVKKSDYQLAGFTALFIAGKYEEVDTPCIKQFIQISDKLYSAQQILKMESIILQSLKFDLIYESPLWYLKYFSYFLQLSSQEFKFCNWLLQITLLKLNSKIYHPFLLTLAIILESNESWKNLTVSNKSFWEDLKMNRREIKEIRQQVRKIQKQSHHSMYQEINIKYKQLEMIMQ